MFGIGGFELAIILLFGFLIVGPEKLPDIARTIGKALRTFQNARAEVSEVVRNDIYDPNAEDPFKDPLAAIDKVTDITKKTKDSLKSDITSEKERMQKRKRVKAGNHRPANAENNASSAEKSTETKAVAEKKVAAVEKKAAAVQTESAATQATVDAVQETAQDTAPAQESFTQRRARYERERAQRLEEQAAQGKEE